MPASDADEVCPHCGAVLDVQKAMREDGAAVSGARRHQRGFEE